MLLFPALFIVDQSPKLDSNGLWGYVSASVQTPPEQFGYGVSLYSSAWPLIEQPIRDFQIGLASTWIMPDNRLVNTPLVPHGTLARDSMPERGPSFRDVFQTIEGGLGFWASNRFWSSTARFRMNGTPDGYNHEISSPGWEFGGHSQDVDAPALPGDQMGIAQLSAHVLVPPDGVTLRKDTCGELFGYAWMALPLIPAKTTPVPTGNQSWTMFLNTQNFKGPVAFYVPGTWSRMSRNYPPAVGRGLDARPGIASSGAIEINTVPRLVSQDSKGDTYSRIPRLQFPADKNGRTVLMHNLTVYSKEALFDQIEAWIAGGQAPSGKFAAKGAFLPTVKANPFQIHQGQHHQLIEGSDKWVQTTNIDATTFGLQWKPALLTSWKSDVRKQDGLVDAFHPLRGCQLALSRAPYLSPPRERSVRNEPGERANPRTKKSTSVLNSPAVCLTKPYCVWKGVIPEYTRFSGGHLTAISPGEVPSETGLQTAKFLSADQSHSYTSPIGRVEQFGAILTAPNNRRWLLTSASTDPNLSPPRERSVSPEERGRTGREGFRSAPEKVSLINLGIKTEQMSILIAPTSPDDVWHKPGPKAGPFTARLADGSVVTYYWYRFIDQPSLQDANLSDSEKLRLQALAEKIQANWTTKKEYMAPPKIGKLASLDPALLVTPPKGLEIGYVPIATRQSPSQ